jgi:hypothetical protein
MLKEHRWAITYHAFKIVDVGFVSGHYWVSVVDETRADRADRAIYTQRAST